MSTLPLPPGLRPLAARLASLDRALAAGLIDEAAWQLELQRAWASAAKPSTAKPCPTLAESRAMGRKKHLRIAA